MTIYCDDEYRIVKDKRGYVVINIKGEYDNHSHIKKESTCHLLIKLVKRKTLPRSNYLLEAARRISIDDKYIRDIEIKQSKEKHQYVNVNKGKR